MRAAWLLVLAACGSSAKSTTKPGSTSKASAHAGRTVTIVAMRDTIKKLCGKAYQEANGVTAQAQEGCDLTPVGAWRGKMKVEVFGDDVASAAVELTGAASELEAIRARAVEAMGPLLADSERPVVLRALARVFQGETGSADGGFVGGLQVRARTELRPEAPASRTVKLWIGTSAFAKIEKGAHPQYAETAAKAPPLDAPLADDPFPSPAKGVPESWVAEASAVCTELVKLVSKTHKVQDAPPVWTAGDVFVSCAHPNENVVAQFTVTWSPTTKRFIYGRFVAELPQAKFSAFAERLFAPLLGPEQVKVTRTAAKKAPSDRKFDADGLQVGSRHESGGFFGETHELELSVQVGYKP